MSYLNRAQLEDLATTIADLAHCYKTEKKGEMVVDRLMFGYLAARHRVQRQVVVQSQGATRRIDFLVGGEQSGTYIELVVRLKGSEWYLNANTTEMNKLCRSSGKQRALMIIDISKIGYIKKDKLVKQYKSWKSTPGKYKRRNVCVVYANSSHSYSFGIKSLKASLKIAK